MAKMKSKMGYKGGKNTMKTNVKNEDIIEGEYEVIKDDDKK